MECRLADPGDLDPDQTFKKNSKNRIRSSRQARIHNQSSMTTDFKGILDWPVFTLDIDPEADPSGKKSVSELIPNPDPYLCWNVL